MGRTCKSVMVSACTLAFLLIQLAAGKTASALTGREVVEKSENAVRANSMVSVYKITVKTRRWTRTMELKYYEYRHRRTSFSEISSPKKDAGNRFLLIKDNMWHYVPKLQQTIKISPSMMLNSWMGSDFTNDDIVKESSIINDYSHKLLGEQTAEGQACLVVELKPKPGAAVVWGKIIYFARKSDFLPVMQEFYNEHNVKKKVMTCSDFRKLGGRIIPTLYKMQSVGKPDRYTLMKIEKINFNVNIPSRIFSKQNLERK